MSNDIAIATVTTALKYILETGISRGNSAIEVTTLPPQTPADGMPKLGINIYLFRINPNLAVANSDLRSRRPKGDLIKKTQTALDLEYLITFYGDETKLEPHKLAGLAIQSLSDHAVLTPEMITRALAPSMDPEMSRSDLIDQTSRVKITQMPLSTDDLSKIWSTLVQVPYRLTVAYQASMVLIESNEPGELSLPLRERRFFAVIDQPIIEKIISETSGQRQPILATSTLLIQGQNLAAAETRVRIGSQLLIPQNITPTQVTISLAGANLGDLHAGIQPVQIIHPNPNDSETTIESNAVAFLLCPTIRSTNLIAFQVNRKGVGNGQILVELDLYIGISQRVLILLNKVISDGDNDLTAYIFRAERRQTETHTLSFLIQNVKPGRYLVRVQVDGAESLLRVDSNSQSVTFNQYYEPHLVIG